MFCRLLSLLFITACSPDNIMAHDDSWLVTEDTGFLTEDFQLKLGQWNVTNPISLSDTCSVGDYQDVNEMVPTSFRIEESETDLFQTDDVLCVIEPEGNKFVCESIKTEEEALSGTAKLQIKTTMKGVLLSETMMDLEFDVVVESCEGAGCFLINMALDFPCPVTLKAKGSI